MKTKIILLMLTCIAPIASAMEYHVSVIGNDQNDGSPSKPFRTITSAAQIAQPGDVITVHEGTYREKIIPPRGGDSDARRIVYQAAPGEKVSIKGSEEIKNWKLFVPGVWKVTLPNTFFGKYNPYKDLIVGDWFSDKGRPHHTGEVYLKGKSLYETHLLERLVNPKPYPDSRDRENSVYTWFCESDSTNTYIYANFHDYNPNEECVEINVRDSCFYPDKPGCNYITIRGFHMSQAATQWAPPTAEQIGLIGTHWSKGWIIENNVISDSKCSGITLGKERKTGHNVWTKEPSKDGAIHYNEVVVRALEIGWSRENIGSHIVRNNTIFNCEQTGICGSLGAVYSTITNNHIYNIWTKRQFTGAEIGGIKIHASIDMLIKNNRIHNAGRGIWMDWMAQGTRITGNLLYDNTTDDLFVEVNHGPFMVDNNFFLSEISLMDWSQGGAYVHNLMTGKIISQTELKRSTPYHVAHGTRLAGLSNIKGGDNRFYNNIMVAKTEQPAAPKKETTKSTDRFAGYGLWVYDTREFPLSAGGNLYFKNARPYAKEENFVRLANDPTVAILDEGDRVYLQLTIEPGTELPSTSQVTSELLGKAFIPKLPFENADGTSLSIDTDYFGTKRNTQKPFVGPLENLGTGKLKIKIW